MPSVKQAMWGILLGLVAAAIAAKLAKTSTGAKIFA